MALYDAHNHFQDEKFAGILSHLEREISASRVSGVVINGTRRSDWTAVLAIAQRNPWAIASVGYHPWYLDELPQNWREQFEEFVTLNRVAIGEIGIDGWKPGLDRNLQREVCAFQLSVAQRNNLPVSIHGLKAWSELLDILKGIGELPAGFLLHSYSGDRSYLKPFIERGAYFSCSGAFLEPKRAKTFDLYKEIPIDRLMIESDAPDQLPPEAMDTWGLTQSDSKARLTHPLSVELTYRALAIARGVELSDFEVRIEGNFKRLFGAFIQAQRV
jgi:TatD DNase family protein